MCKTKPPEVHKLCKSCSTQQVNTKRWWDELQLIHDSDEVGEVVKIARTLSNVPPVNVSSVAWGRKEIELSAVESPPSECTGCCDARTNTEFHSACKRNVSIVADGPISGEERDGSRRPKTIAKDSRHDEVGEVLPYQSGAGSSQPCPVETEARSRTAIPRVKHVSHDADDHISGDPKERFYEPSPFSKRQQRRWMCTRTPHSKHRDTGCSQSESIHIHQV